jgi:hypothetical protein
MRENSYILLQSDKNPFDLLQDPKYDDTEIKCSDYLMEGQSNEIETQSNSNSEKKSSPKSLSRELPNRYMDFEENLKARKKKQKKLFKVVAKNENLIDQVLDKNMKEMRKNKVPNEVREKEFVLLSKGKLMKIKRMKQKKLLEQTRGIKRTYSSDENEKSYESTETKRKESITKKKKALQNRISAQKSIEKKKNIINQIKNEKENLSNENFHLKLELEKKNHEIELLKSKLTSFAHQDTFNYSGKSNVKFNFVSASILVVCLIVLTFDNSEGGDNHPHHTTQMHSVIRTQIPRVSRMQININNDTNIYNVANDIRLYNNIKQKLHLTHHTIHQRININRIDYSSFGVCMRRIYFFEFCEKND